MFLRDTLRKTKVIQLSLPFGSKTLKENATRWFRTTGKHSCSNLR